MSGCSFRPHFADRVRGQNLLINIYLKIIYISFSLHQDVSNSFNSNKLYIKNNMNGMRLFGGSLLLVLLISCKHFHPACFFIFSTCILRWDALSNQLKYSIILLVVTCLGWRWDQNFAQHRQFWSNISSVDVVVVMWEFFFSFSLCESRVNKAFKRVD